MSFAIRRNDAALSLYRRILRLHRQKLPYAQRSLGDSYVKKEFRDHKSAKPEFVTMFMKEWNSYADSLEAQKVRGGEKLGEELPGDVVELLSDDQKMALERLKEEAKQFKP